MKPTDIRIEDVAFSFEDYLYRTPIKFGGIAVDRVDPAQRDLHRSHCGRASVAAGLRLDAAGQCLVVSVAQLGYDDTLGAMKALAERVARPTAGCTEVGHPIDIAHVLEPEYHKAAAEVTRRLALAEPIPPLCTLVVASPFDAALHDAFGKVHGLNCYHTYGPDFLQPRPRPLSRAPSFAARRSTATSPREPQAADAAVSPGRRPRPAGRRATSPSRSAMACPRRCGEWIAYNGLTHIKIKLNGDDLGWDVERVVRVDRMAADGADGSAASSAGATRWTSTSAAPTSATCWSSWRR